MAIGALDQRERGARSPLKTGGIGRGAVLSQWAKIRPPVGRSHQPRWQFVVRSQEFTRFAFQSVPHRLDMPSQHHSNLPKVDSMPSF